jgi:tetratricopeptide (TPR) repeat protein
MSKNANKTFLSANVTLWVISLFVSLAPTAFAQPQQQPEDPNMSSELYKILKAQKEERYTDAIAALNQEIAKNTSAEKSDFNLLVRKIAFLKYDNVIDGQLTGAFYLSQLYGYRAMSYMRMRKFEQAARDIDASLKIYPAGAEARCNKAQLYLKTGKLPEAINVLNESLALAPASPAPHRMLSQIYRSIGKNAESIRENATYQKLTALQDYSQLERFKRLALDKAVRLNPKNQSLYIVQSELELNKQKAIALLKKALSIDPTDDTAYSDLCDRYRYEDEKQALTYINLAVKYAPKKSEHWENKAEVEAELDDYKAAISSYSMAIKLSPSEFLYTQRANLRIKINDFSGCISDCDAALRLDPKLAEPHGIKAICYKNQKRYQLAIDEASKAIAIEPKDCEYYGVRGYCYKQIGKIELARLDLEKASRINPRDKEVHEAASNVEALSGNLETALSEAHDAQRGSELKTVNAETLKREIASYTKIIAVAKTKPEPYYDRAMLRAALNDWKSSVEDLRKFLTLTSWKGRSSAYAACFIVLFLRENALTQEATAFISEANRKINSDDKVWFLYRLQNEKPKRNIPIHETRDGILHAIDLFQHHRFKEAQDEIKVLQTHGDRGIDEFVLVSVYNKRITDALSKRKT